MFSELVVAYLFLGGTGAGALLIAAVLMLLADERAVSRGVVVRFRDNGSAAYRRLFVPILVASLVVLVLGTLCLAADVGAPRSHPFAGGFIPFELSGRRILGTFALWHVGGSHASCVARGAVGVSASIQSARCLACGGVFRRGDLYGTVAVGYAVGAVVVRPVAAGAVRDLGSIVRSGACGHGGSIFGNGDGFRPNDAASRSRRYGSSCPGGGRRGAVARCSVAGTRRLGFLGGNAYRCGRVGIGGLRIERCVLSAVLGRPCARWPCCSFCDRGCPRALQCE